MNINLLPPELMLDPGVKKMGHIVSRLAISGFSLFVVLASAGLIWLFFLGREYDNSQKRILSLKEEILALNSAEQSLHLVRDRLSKVGHIVEDKKIERQLEKVRLISSGLSSEISVNEIEVDNNKTKLTVVSNSPSGVSRFFGELISKKLFTRIFLKNFNYSQDAGYFIALELMD